MNHNTVLGLYFPVLLRVSFKMLSAKSGMGSTNEVTSPLWPHALSTHIVHVHSKYKVTGSLILVHAARVTIAQADSFLQGIDEGS